MGQGSGSTGKGAFHQPGLWCLILRTFILEGEKRVGKWHWRLEQREADRDGSGHLVQTLSFSLSLLCSKDSQSNVLMKRCFV